MDHDGCQRSEPDPALRLWRRRAIARVAIVLGLGLGWGAAAGAASNAVRLPEGEFAGESWDLIASLDTGHRIVAQAALSNLGPGDHKAVVLGHLIGPDGSVVRFKRSEPAGKWALTGGGHGLDLHSISLDPFGPERRFVVAKDDLGIDLRLRRASAPAREQKTGACSFELLEPGAPASVTLRLGARATAIATQGRVALTHRWSSALESECVLRRVEVFGLERELGFYFSETTTPQGDVSRWLVAERDGRVLFAGDPGDAPVRWGSAADGFAPPASARFAAAGLSARIDFEPAIASVDPTERLPATVQWLLQTRTKPRLSWMRAPFELRTATGTIVGEALAKVTYSNPLPRGRVPARVAAHSEK